jgi:predicted AlkP superfamily pyrophosphatase or phosphodiesterase
MIRRAVLNVVGLSARDLSSGVMPRLMKRAGNGSATVIRPAFPAVTCTAQSNYLTGQLPSVHGIVGNGWYDRSLSEVHFWKQSNRLVGAPKVWDVIHERRPGAKVANLFWWYNMGTQADLSVTPRPIYKADGGKIFDIASYPQRLKPALKSAIGEFPFHSFWGPRAGIAATQWIADAARWIEKHEAPDLNLVYLPHLDYDLQRFGPNDPQSNEARKQMDGLVCDLAEELEAAGVEVIILSEYAITEVDRPVALNRIFREKGWLEIKKEDGAEILDVMNSKVFAVVDHQIAHVVIQDEKLLLEVKALLEKTAGVGQVLDRNDQDKVGINHTRSGDLIAVADARSWFSYYWWNNDDLAPDYARTVDIHRKPGYDPAELFIDPAIKWPALRVASFLLKKRLGMRALLQLTPLSGEGVRGSHGRIPEDSLDWPVLIVGTGISMPWQISSLEVTALLVAGL